MEHVEAIAHPDIKGLYRRELLDRFSAFAYPPREPRAAFAPRRFSGTPKPPSLLEGSAERLRSLTQGSGRDALATAVIAGLVRYPDQLVRHAEALVAYRPADPAIARAIDILLDHAETLENGAQSPIKGLQSLATPPDHARYSFLLEDQHPQSAREDLAEAVAMLVERPALDAALAAATARFDADPEGAIAEQQRLKKAIEDAVLAKAREVRKYLDPSITVNFGVAVLPDAVYDLCNGIQAETFQLNVVLVSYSMFVPYLLLVFQTTLKNSQSIDLQKLDAYLHTAQESIKTLQEELDGRFSRSMTMLNNSRDDMRVVLGKLSGSLTGLQMGASSAALLSEPAGDALEEQKDF